jgi:outer membrane immunogenic protein
MKKLLPAIVGLAAAILFAGAAQADGMYQGSIKDTPIVAPAGWSGFYFGAGVGYGDSVIDNHYSESGGDFISTEGEGLRGGLATIILGLDRQIGDRWVIGAFVDFDWSDIELTYFDNTLSAEEKLTLDWMWSIGGRLGYLFNPNTMIYFAGGFTQAHFDNGGYYDITNSGTTFPGKSPTHDGFFVAFGLEALLNPNLSLRGEMRYAEYDSEVINSGTLLGTSFVDEAEPTVWTGRFTLTYRIPHGNRITPVK